MALKSANNARGLNGVENISENILRSRTLAHAKDTAGDAEAGAGTPMRHKRRLSPYTTDKATDAAGTSSQLGKRSSASDVKRCVGCAIA